MSIVQFLASEERMIYAPAVWLVVGLILGWLLCKGGVG